MMTSLLLFLLFFSLAHWEISIHTKDDSIFHVNTKIIIMLYKAKINFRSHETFAVCVSHPKHFTRIHSIELYMKCAHFSSMPKILHTAASFHSINRICNWMNSFVCSIPLHVEGIRWISASKWESCQYHLDIFVACGFDSKPICLCEGVAMYQSQWPEIDFYEIARIFEFIIKKKYRSFLNDFHFLSDLK